MPDIKTNIKLSGESEYRKSLSEISSGMKVLKSEMQLTTAQFAENGKSVEALKAKNDVLERSISSQEDKLRLMREQLVKTAQTYGEGSEKTMKLQAAVNGAETELVKMKGELKKNEEAMEESGKASSSLGDKLQGVADKLGVKLPAGAQTAINGLKKVDANLALAATGAAALITAFVKLEKAMFSMAKEAAAAADELVTLSQKMGVSTKTLQEFQYAAELVDVDVSTLQGSLTKLTTNMVKAAEGNEATSKAFDDLHVSVTNTDGSLRKADDVFLDLIDALGTIDNQTERDAAAMEIFGKSAQDLNPLIKQGSQALKDLALEANATGYVLDDISLNKLTAMDDALVKLDKTQESFRKRMAAEFAPYVTEAIEKVTQAFQLLGDAVVDSGAAQAVGMILDSVLKILDPLDQLNNGKLPTLQAALNGIAQLCAVISDSINVIVYGLGTIKNAAFFNFGDASKYLEGFKTSLGLYGTNNYQTVLQTQRRAAANREAAAARSANSSLQSSYTPGAGDWNSLEYNTLAPEYYDALIGSMSDEDILRKNWGYNAGGTSRWRGGWSWVGENGPELAYLPAGSQVKSASESRGVGGDTFYITIDAKSVKEFNDVVRLAQTARLRMRKEAAG